MISIGRKLFEETDTPTESKIVDEDKVNKLIQRQSSWIGNIRGIDPFPSGKVSGSGPSFIHENGITISHWQGVFTPKEDVQEREELRFILYFIISSNTSMIPGLSSLVLLIAYLPDLIIV